MTSLIPAVQLIDGSPRVSSLAVSGHFGKRHTRVIDAIRKTSSETASEFSQNNFVPAEYTDEQGKTRPMYLLSRDGFTLVAMGFTGKAALTWKVRYIEAFNAMEKALIEDGHAAKALPEPVQTDSDASPDNTPKRYRMQLESIWNSFDEKAYEFRRWMQTVHDELGQIAGPLYKDVLHRLTAGNTPAYGSAAVSLDRLIGHLHHYSHEAVDGANACTGSMYDAINLARKYAKLLEM